MSRKFTEEEITKLPKRQQKRILRNRRKLESNREEANRLSREQYHKHIEKRRQYERLRSKQKVIENVERRRKRKQECFSHYSDEKIKCAICGIDDLDVLTLDHINGGGKKERDSFCKGRGGDRMYSFLKRNKYPPGYRILCFNHNFKEALRKKQLITKKKKEEKKMERTE